MTLALIRSSDNVELARHPDEKPLIRMAEGMFGKAWSEVAYISVSLRPLCPAPTPPAMPERVERAVSKWRLKSRPHK